MRMPLHRWLFSALCSTGCATAHEPASELDPSPTAPQPDASFGLDAPIATVNAATSTVDAGPRPGPEGSPPTVFEPDAAPLRDARSDDATTGDASPLDARAAPETPPDWQCVQGECGLRLCGPTDMVAIPAAGFDTCMATFQTLDCRYSGGFAVAWHESDLDVHPEYTLDHVRMGGVVARLETFKDPSPTSLLPYLANLSVSSLPLDGQLALSFSASCKTAEARDTALRVLQTIELPTGPIVATTLAPTTPTCTGFDEQPLQGWLLGSACVGPKVSVPGACAVGAKTKLPANAGGKMRCLVSPQGDYLWAYVPYGEGVVASPSGSRVDGLVFGSGQLSMAEFERCAELSGRLGTLDGGVTDAAAGEPDYVRCP